ncbi:succinate dehydrogenase assembly factor 4, mitochondrial-like [Clytia hemisphaerica]|uniref:Succinate dehydrogenase assembly factor 4, mitochondrial n=1 Tax=Clytia hemisphaerica TaxID=252671 RepID=A0A7M5V0D6_9CNID
MTSSLKNNSILSNLVKQPRQILTALLHTNTRLLVSDKILEEKTPLGKFSEAAKATNEQKPTTSAESEEQEPDPYAPFPEATNPETGEIGGPLGPEPTRYGDWERKGRCSDF